MILAGIADGSIRPGADARLAMLAVLGMCNAVINWRDGRPGDGHAADCGRVRQAGRQRAWSANVRQSVRGSGRVSCVNAANKLRSADELRRTTAPALLLERARAQPDAVAFRAKQLGIYRERTWRAVRASWWRARPRRFAAQGLAAGERVAIMADACEEWLICDQAAQSLGAIVYGIYPTASPEEVEYQMRDGGAVLFVAEDQEYVDRILPIADRLPALRRIVVVDDTALFAFAHDKLVAYDDAVRGRQRCRPGLAGGAGRQGAARAAGLHRLHLGHHRASQGRARHARQASGRHAVGRRAVSDADREAAPHGRLPAAVPRARPRHRRDPAADDASSCRTSARAAEDLPETLFETAPTVLFTVPRYLQKMAAQVLVQAGSTSAVKRFAYDRAMAFARAHVKRRWAGTATGLSSAPHAAWRAAVFRPILNKIGFDQLELVVSGGAPLPAETMAVWHMLGVNVCEMYGQTETAGGIIAGQRGPFPRPGDVGTVPEGFEVKLADDGEILVRSPDLFEGYWNNPEASLAVLGTTGWMRTGDVGAWRDGNLQLIDRARDFLVTSGGKTISPSFIENRCAPAPISPKRWCSATAASI